MAAKEKKSTVTKQLKDNQSEKEKVPETPKSKRGRKSLAQLSPEQKSPKTLVRRKRTKDNEDGRSTSGQKRARRSALEQDEAVAGKTPPPGQQKVKKTHLEKELGDLLENATGRNTPTLPRNKRLNEKEEDSLDSVDERGGLLLPRGKKDVEDDNVSVKSMSTLSRTRKNAEKDMEDDVLSVRSVNVKSKKNDSNEEDASSVKSLIRPNLMTKSGRKKKSVLTAIAVKKKIFIRRGRPKKINDLNEGKGKHLEEKRVARIKVVDKTLGESKQKRVIKKPLKFQSKIKDQARLRSTLAIKNQNVKKTKLKLSVKNQGSTKQRGEADVAFDQVGKERLRTESQNAVGKSESPEGFEGSTKKKVRKRRKEDKKEEDSEEGSERASDVYFFAEAEAASGGLVQQPRGKGGRFVKVGEVKGKAGRKKRRESGIHFETTRSPDDSSVMIVHPRLGPKIRPAKRLKPILPKTEEMGKGGPKGLPKDAVPATVLPTPLSATVPSFNQIGSSYLVQSIPNFNIFAANSSIVRNYSSNSNFETMAARPGDMAHEDSAPSYGAKTSPNEIIVTPSGIVLSGSRLVSPGSQHSTICFNGSNSNFVAETSNGEAAYSPKEATESGSGQGLLCQGGTTVVQPQSGPASNTAIFLKRPEAMSTSLISTAAGAFLVNSSMAANGNLKVSNVKPHSVCNPSTDTIVSEKALEGDFQDAGSRFKNISTNNISKLDFIPSIPVAKNVNDLILLKNRSNLEVPQRVKTKKTAWSSSEKSPSEVPRVLREANALLTEGRPRSGRTPERKARRRTLRNVRHFLGSGSELTFSEPESSSLENDDACLFKTISCERINNSAQIVETKPNVLLQLGSEPLTISETLLPFETASMLLVTKKEKLEEKLEMEGSPKVKEAVDVCRFSKENEEALKEFGLDSDLDQGKSDGDSPVKNGKTNHDFSEDGEETTKKAKIKQEVDNVLKEMPIRRIPNFHRKSEPFKITKGRMDLKSPLMHKNSDYLCLSPSKPPTVIDKLLEKNKSLKKAEQEGKFQNAIRNLSEDAFKYEVVEVRPRRNLRETKTRKYTKAVESRRGAQKRFVHENSGCKIFERRGSNPEIYSSDYLTAKSQVANENVPLRRVTDPGDGKFQRRGSIDYESIRKVLDRRCSLPTPAEDLADPKLSKSMDDVNKIKTENIKTIIVGGSSKPLTSKNREYDVQPRVINIVTSNCGYKKGKNLMEEICLEMGPEKKGLLNGENRGGRRVSIESSNSEPETMQKLVEGLSRGPGNENRVPYFGEESSERAEKMRLALERSSLEEKEGKGAVIEETPEDLVTKETILSALGLQSLKAAAQSAQKKKDSQSQASICQAENGGYTGTLKTVIKIQRQEKKGSSKSPIKMVYKASSSSSSVSGQLEDSNNFDETETMSKEEAEETVCEESKNGNGKAKSLVIPEKASSFSIHPGRMCSDVCTYCFGKFGLLDTPCHIAQLKDADKRRNILATEVHLTADSCLCDACFRHVDKKSNCPTFTDKKGDVRKRSVRKQTCIVQNCNAESQHSIKRKLFLKLKKSIGRKVVLDAGKLEKLQPGQSLTFCNRHIYWIDYFMSCGICKKRLTSVNMYRVTSEVLELNAALSSDEIPAILTENRFLCKICNCFASIRLKCKNPNEMSSGHRQFYETCRKRILKCHGMDVPDSEAEGDGKSASDQKSVRRSKKSSKPTATVTNESSKSDNEASVEEVDKATESEKELKEVSHMNIPPKTNRNLDFGGVSIAPATTEVNPTQIHVKLGNLNIGALGNLNIGQDVRHGGARGGDIQCFPTETELALRAHFDLKPSAEDESAKTVRKGFEKCTTTIQFSPETKNLFYNLQMPYGNQSSFFRHLILLEKYFRSGDLVISRNADPKAVNYISSVQNRIRSYEGVHSAPGKKPQEIPPSLSILPQPIKPETRCPQELKAGAVPSRPFTLTPMPSNSFAPFLKNSPLGQIQATVQNIQPVVQHQSQGLMTSLLKSSLQSSKYASHPKPEVSITSVSGDGSPPVRVGKASVLTSKIQENLRNLASKSQAKQPNQARAVILNRTVGGQKQSLVQVTTGGKTIHLTLSQFRRIQQMQMRKKQYLEHQAKMLKGKEDQARSKQKVPEDGFTLKNLSPELEIQELKQKPNGSGNGSEMFPLISEVRSLAGEDTLWDKGDSNDGSPTDFPKIPKTLSVSVTKIPPPDYSVKEQSVEPVE